MNDKFKIICLECESEDVRIRENVDYYYEEMPYVNGYYLECNECGNNDL